MKYLRFFLLLSSCFLIASSLWAGDSRPKVAPQPSWVKPISIDYRNTSLDDKAEDGYVDLHYEKQISLAQQSSFLKKAIHVLSESGVQNLSQISIDYDPSYEQLTLHSVNIIRDGQLINKLQLSHIKTIQREKELDKSIYNGMHTAVLILDDLRKDDILEYSYTIKGFNPIFGNKYAENYSVQFDVPIYGLYYRLLVPKGRSVTVANSLTNAKPVLITTAAETIYEWQIKNEHPAVVEKSLPSWYDAYPMIMVSEFNSWEEVNNWATQLFSFTAPLSPALQKKVDEIKNTFASSEKRLLAALRFVQDDVRYMGIEMGESSHKPHAPSQVFQQRFGDCKDKAYLLCTMLRALQIEAYPVLINTVYKKTINGWLPSPTAFDHTTVCAVLNSKQYWLDATIAYQRGSLDDISYPSYQTGLIVKPGTTTFTSIPSQDKGKTTVKEAFYVNRVGGPAELIVRTKFTGSYADDMRYNFKNKSVGEIQKECKTFYSAYFKQLQADSLRYEDDEATGMFSTTEYYTVRDFWKEKNGSETVSLEPYLVNSVVKKPEDPNRTMPFALYYPVDYEEEIEVHMPKDWPVTESSDHYESSAFVFDCEYSNLKSDVVLLKYRYKNLKDHVAPNELSDYLSKWETAEKGMGFGLSDDFSSEPVVRNKTIMDTGTNPNSAYTVAYVLLGICTLATYVYRRSNRQRNFWD